MATPKYPSECLPKFMVRFPPELKEWLAGQAATNRRSQNAELIHRLEAMRRQEQAGQNAQQVIA